MAELPLIDPDNDLLPLLRLAPNALLDPLVSYITNNGKGRLTSELDLTELYSAHHPNHSAYVDEIAAEVQKFGGNTIVNVLRGGKGIPYIEVVRNVARQLKVNFNDSMDAGRIELQILLRILEKAYEKMTEEERRQFLLDIGLEYGKVPDALPVIAIQAALGAAGFLAYQLAVIVANAVARQLLGRGLSLALNRTLARSLNVLVGPIGWAITVLWTLVDIAGPAYRVIIPCVIQVALIRQQSLIQTCSNGHQNSSQAKFCAECGASLSSDGKRPESIT
ncbi:MAG: ubiquinol-cytochrome C chaperone family protein [Candidatus Binatia bacterium]